MGQLECPCGGHKEEGLHPSVFVVFDLPCFGKRHSMSHCTGNAQICCCNIDLALGNLHRLAGEMVARVSLPTITTQQ